MTTEYFNTSRKKTRGRPPGLGKKSLATIDRIIDIAGAIQPCTGRSIGYKLFVAGLIKAMSTNECRKSIA
jgi:hypothetical protein